MKKIDLGQAANTIANLGVIVGIAFLVYELRQNNEILELEAYRTFNDRALSDLDLMVSNPWITDAALADPSSLTREQSYLRQQMATRRFLVWEEQYELILAGRFAPEEVVTSWRTIFWTPEIGFGMPDFWERYKPRARPDFVEFVDEFVVEPGPIR